MAALRGSMRLLAGASSFWVKMADYPKFSDFAKGEAKLDEEKVKLKDILNPLEEVLRKTPW
jgi:hypothetical protein